MVGIDSSPSMLAAAGRHASANVRFAHGDIAGWSAPGDHDLVLSNAALHWVPDHRRVLTQWVAALAPGGQLAVQVPANPEHPSHQSSVAVAHSEPFLSAMGGDPPADPVDVNVLKPEEYAELLFDLGLAEQHVRLQVYPHVLPSSAHVVEWTKGTSLTRFFARLPEELHEPFVDAYRDELLRRIGDREPYFYAFQRILIWGRVASESLV
jgi:trans-aconitate 2-methyltransferase